MHGVTAHTVATPFERALTRHSGETSLGDTRQGKGSSVVRKRSGLLTGGSDG